jgi:DNA repair exonuclease SbcCD ATPase subunit
MAKPLSASPEKTQNSTPLPNSVLRWSGRDPASSREAAPAADDLTDSNSPIAEENMNQLLNDGNHSALGGKPRSEAGPDEMQELEILVHENAQLRNLCLELEQALHEATQQQDQRSDDERLRDYEAMLEEKSDTIRQLHQELQNAHSIVADMEAQLNDAMEHRPPTGPAPREEELLALSEELESERKQLQEDEQTLMDQMREMEVSMARERAEMARQRNDLGRLQSDIRHELERLEKSGAAVRKMEELKRQFADATNRRGLAASGPGKQSAAQQEQQPQPPPKKDNGLMGRLFGGGK